MLGAAGRYRGSTAGSEKAMNYYLTSQLIAERQASVAAGVTHRARLLDASGTQLDTLDLGQLVCEQQR